MQRGGDGGITPGGGVKEGGEVSGCDARLTVGTQIYNTLFL